MARVPTAAPLSIDRSSPDQAHAPLASLLQRPVMVGGLIMLVGAMLRLYHLGTQSLWLDEVVTATAPSHHSFQDLIAWTQWDNQMPLYNLITWLLAPLGHGETFLRLPATAAGILIIPAMYWLGSETFGKRTGMVAAGLMAIMPFAIWYSQEARPYAFLMLFSALQLVFAYRAVRGPAAADWVGLAVATLLNLYTHYMAIAATFGVCAFILFALAYRGFHAIRGWDGPSAVRRWVQTTVVGLACAGVIVVGYLPWVPTLRNFLHRPTQGLGRFAGLAHAVTLADVLGLLGSFNLTGVVLVLVCVGLIACIVLALRGELLPAALPLLGLLLPLAAVSLKLRGGLFEIFPRYLSFMFPAAILLAAIGTDRIVQVSTHLFLYRGRRESAPTRGFRALPRYLPPVVTLLLVAGLLAQLSPEVVAAYDTRKDDYRDAAAWVAGHSPPGSVMLAMGQYSNFITISMGYYLAQHAPSISVTESKELDSRLAAQFDQSHGAVWAALFTSYAPNDLERVSTAGLLVKRFVGVAVIRAVDISQPPRLQAEALLQWGTGFEPELKASIDLLHVLAGDQSSVRRIVATEGHWAIGPGAQSSAAGVVLQPGGGTANATFTLSGLTAGEMFSVLFSYRNDQLHGEQRVFVSTHDKAGQWLQVFPNGAGYGCTPGSARSEGAFAFTVPANGVSLVVWLRATGTGQASFETLRLLQTG